MKEITLENLLDTDEKICKCTEEMDEVLRQTLSTADTLKRVADLIAPSDEKRDGETEHLKEIEAWYNKYDLCRLRAECRDSFKALVWLVKNTTICEQVAAKVHDTLKFNVERAAEKMLQEIKEYNS